MKKKILFIFLFLIYSSLVYGAEYILLDDMENKKNWYFFADEKGSEGELISIPGKRGKAVGMEFSLGDGFWVVIGKELNLDLTGLERLRFYYKYRGLKNNLEIKLIDEDGSVFGIKKQIREIKDWDLMELNFSDFKYWWGGDEKLDLKKIKKIEFVISKESGGEGEFDIDEIEYKRLRGEELFKPGELKAGSLVIDEFERIDPLTMYLPVKGDDSELNLRSTRQYVIEGNYSMEMEYKLKPVGAYPTYVSARWQGEKPLDWSRVKLIKVWVKGDGSGNYFRINIIDRDGEIWSYEDRKVLLYKKWQLITIPVEKLKIPAWAKKKNGIFDSDVIRGYEISIAGRNPEMTWGKVYIDHLYVIGKELIPALVVPEEVRKPVRLLRPQGNFDVKGLAVIEYKKTPAEGKLLGSYGRVIFESRLKKFGFYTEITIGYKKFGEAVAIDEEGVLQERKPELESTSTYVYLVDILPYLYYITIGNLWIDFSDYTFSPYHTKSGEWGYKGVYADGRVGKFSIQMFLLTHNYNSYTWGIRTDRTYRGLFFRSIFVKYTGRAKVESSGKMVNGVIDKSLEGEFKTERIDDDYVFTFNFEKYIFWFLKLSGMYGQNYKIKYAEANYSDPFNPIFNYKLTSPQKSFGDLMKLEFDFIDFPVMDFRFYFNIRDIDNNFKPKYRRKPEEFDELTSNQQGINLKLSYDYTGWNFAIEGDYFRRKTDNSKYRKWLRWGVGRFNLYNFDISFNQEFKWQDDYYEKWLAESPVRKHEEITTYIFRTTYRFTGGSVIDEVRLEDIYHPETGNRFSTAKFYFKLEYFIAGNSRFYLEYQFYRPGSIEWAVSEINEDYLKATLEMSF